MMHKGRIYGEPAVIGSAGELAEKLTQYDWTTCSAWKLGPLLFLNDATGGDGAQEYAVLRPIATCACPPCCDSYVLHGALTGQRACRCPSPYHPAPLCVSGYEQIESITFSWCSVAEALDYITKLRAGTLGEVMGAPFLPRFHPKGETCGGCA